MNLTLVAISRLELGQLLLKIRTIRRQEYVIVSLPSEGVSVNGEEPYALVIHAIFLRNGLELSWINQSQFRLGKLGKSWETLLNCKLRIVIPLELLLRTYFSNYLAGAINSSLQSTCSSSSLPYTNVNACVL